MSLICAPGLFRLTAAMATALYCASLSAETITLDFQQAVKRALEVDHRIAEKRQLVDVARGLLQEAEGANGWIVDLNAFIGLAPAIRGGFFEGGDGRFDPNSLDFDGVSPWYNIDFTVVTPLNTYGKQENYKRAAQNNITVTQGDVSIQRGEIYIEVARAYHGYLTAKDARLMLEDVNNRLQSALDLVEGWLEAEEGKAKQTDKFALETGVALVNRHIARAAGMEEIATAALRMLTAINEGDELQLVDKRIAPVPLPEQSLGDLQSNALRQRPEMTQVEAGLTARRALLAAKRSEKYPNIYTGFGGALAISPDRDTTDEVAVYDPFNHAGLTPVLGVKWDWYTGMQRGQVSQAQAELAALLEKKSFALKGIPFQVAEQYHQVQAHHKMIGELYNGARAGRRWMISAYTDFEAGLEEANKILTALTIYVAAYTDYLQIVNDYNVHVARLQVATGEVQ